MVVRVGWACGWACACSAVVAVDGWVSGAVGACICCIGHAGEAILLQCVGSVSHGARQEQDVL